MIFGLPINLKLSNFEQILKEIIETDIFTFYNSDCEFILSVRIFPYPGMFCSVQLFLGYIFDK